MPSAPSSRSPAAGCAILIAALAVMVFLIVFSIVSLFRQSNEISKFTADHPEAIAVTPADQQAPQLAALAARLEAFHRQLADHNDRATLALTPDELNLAIAAYEPFKDLRGTLRVSNISDGKLRLSISFRLNGKPRLARPDEHGWIASDPRYLNGTLLARPALLNHELVLALDTIEVPGARVPREFIEQMSPYRINERYLTDKTLGPAMARLTRVGVADGKLVLERVPGETPADTIGKEQVDAAARRLWFVLSMVVAAIIVVVVILHKVRRSGPNPR